MWKLGFDFQIWVNTEKNYQNMCLKDLCDKDWLKKSNMVTLFERKARGDLIKFFKISNGLWQSNV